jgi:hypothetical protein
VRQKKLAHTKASVTWKKINMNTLLFKSSWTHFAVVAAMAGTALADPVKDGIVNCAGLQGEENRLQRLACFDRLVEKIKPEEIKPFTEKAQRQSEYGLKKEQDYEEKHANDRWFLRSSTQLGDDNTKPAQIALTRSNSNTTGVANAAIVYATKGGLGEALGLGVKGEEKWYVGVGIQRDDTVATKKVSNSNIRLGYAKAFSVFPKKEKGSAVKSWLSIGRQNDHVAKNAQIQTDLGIEAAYRWIDLTDFKEVKYDRRIMLKFNPFSDKVVNDPSGINPRTSGVGLGLGLSWYRPTDVEWMPQSLSNVFPDRWSFNSLRNVGTAGTKQFSTFNKLGFTWLLAKSDKDHFQPSITLAREVGANFREGLAPSAKTLLTLDLKYN